MSRSVPLSRFWGVLPVALIALVLVLRAVLVTPPLANLARVEGNPRDPAGTVAYQGSIRIARGGPVILGFQSESDARLLVGTGERILKDLGGHGVVKERLLLDAGVVAIRFAAPPGARLVWSPVGRRGDPEYVPASALSPDPPERAQFGSEAGAAPLDGVFAATLLLIIIGTCVMLARARLRLVPRATWIALGAVLLAGCLVRWLDLGGFGQTWDEDVNWSAGRNYITNLLSLDFRAGSWTWNYEHPPVMKYLAGIGAQFADGFGPARALSAVWMSLGCALLVPIGARLYNLRTGVLGALIATLLPHLVGHGQIVGHEAPSVLWWMLGILLALGVHDGEPAARTLRLRLVACGAVIGVAAASRFVNGLVGPLLLAIVIITAPSPRRTRAAIEGALIMPAAALVTFWALWPRLWLHPLAALSESFAKLSQSHSVEPFLGAVTNQPGASYFLVYLTITLPVLVLAGVLAGGVRAIRERNRGALVVALWFVIPLGVMASPVRQDGVRYVMPCVAALALLSAAGWESLSTMLERRVARAFAGVALGLVAYLAVSLVRIHPFYLDYYSELVGGPAGVARRGLAETAWWGEGLATAVDYVNTHAAPGARVSRNCVGPAHLGWFRQDLWAPMTGNPVQADWIVAYAPQSAHCAIPPGFKRVFAVEAQHAVLAEVFAR